MIQQRVTFLGLGVMGFPMAGHLTHQHHVTVWNRTPQKTTLWCSQYQGTRADSVLEAVRHADVVCMCLGRDEDVLDVALNDYGAIAAMPTGSVLIDHTTTSKKCALTLADACKKKGTHFLDAPVSGGQIGAKNGALAIMVGGDNEVYTQVLTLLECYGKRIVRMGENGAGQVAKMVNQICIAHLLQGLSEGMQLAEKAHLDIDTLLSVIGSGAAQSWQMENRAATMTQRLFDFGFAIDWMIKDLSYAIEQAQALGLSLDDTLGHVYRTYQTLAQKGHGREDTSALIRQFDG